MLVVDAHLDLAMNAVMWNRDLALSAHETRAHRARRGDDARRGGAPARSAFPDLRAGEIGLVFATVIARKNHGQNSEIDFRTHEIAYAQAQGQLALLPGAGAPGDHPADPHPRRPRRLASGLGGRPGERAVRLRPADGRRRPDRRPGAGPALVGRRAADGRARPLRPERLRLRHRQRRPADRRRAASCCAVMDELGMMLDVSHLTDESFHEALDRFQGPVLASHSNCRALVPGDRQLDDDMIRRIDRARRRDRRGDGRLDAATGLGPRRDDERARHAGKRSSTTSTTSASSPATPATPPSAPTSTAATAPSRPRTTSTPSPTSRRSPTCSARAATAKPTSPRSCTATGCGCWSGRCRRNGASPPTGAPPLSQAWERVSRR